MIADIYERERRSNDASRIAKLARMLQNILQKWPMARLRVGREGFGASLAEDTWIQIHTSGNLTAEDMRDLLALFAVWCAVDPERVINGFSVARDGASLTAREASSQSNTLRGSHGSR